MIRSRFAPKIERKRFVFFVMVLRLFLFVLVLPHMRILDFSASQDRLNRLILLYIQSIVNMIVLIKYIKTTQKIKRIEEVFKYFLYLASFSVIILEYTEKSSCIEFTLFSRIDP